MRNLVIGTGYHSNLQNKWQGWFHDLWWGHNIEPIQSEKLKDVYVIATEKSPLPERRYGRWIPVHGDLGHCGSIFELGNRAWCPGCPATWMIGAWLAYSSECDFLSIEQDTLCFGPWLEKMYEDLGNKGMVFGTGATHGGSSTCLFLIRWEFIPRWTMDYMMEGPEDGSSRIPEHKMRRVRDRFPEYYASLSFGFDTDRPLDVRAPVFYGQKFTPEELNNLKVAGRIDFQNMPDVPVFTSR